MDSVNNELLIVRHLKRNNENRGVLKRLVGNYFLLHHKHVCKQTIFECLMNIIEKYDLMPYPWKNVRYFFTGRPSFEPNFDDIWDTWIYRASSVIRSSEVKKFPCYPAPAYFRNRINNSHVSDA